MVKKCCRGLYDQEKYSISFGIFKISRIFPGHFLFFFFPGLFKAWKLTFLFFRFSRCVGTLKDMMIFIAVFLSI